MQVRKLFSSGLVLGLVFFVTFPARAELLKNFKTDGSVEVRTFAIDNETDRNGRTDDYRGEANTRIMVGGSFDLLDDAHARILLRKNNRYYGSGNGGGAGGVSEDLGTVQDNLFVDIASIKIDKVFGHVDVTMGRQFYGNSEDLVIYFGPQNDEVLNVTAVDVFRADANIGNWARFEGLAGKVSDDGSSGLGANGDTDLFGGMLSTEKLLPKGMLGLSWYDLEQKGAGAVNNNTVNIVSLCALGDLFGTGLKYHADYMQNFGTDHTVPPSGDDDNDGNALFLGLKYGHDMMKKPFRLMAEWGRGTNNFIAVAPGKRWGKIWGEHSNAGPANTSGVGVGLTNLQVYDAGVGVNLNQKFGVDFNAYRFEYADGNSGGSGGLSNLGTEFDLVLSWKHSDNIALEASAASFQVGDALDNTGGTPTSPITRLGADVKLKF